MNSFNVSELKAEMYFTSEVVLDKSFLLLNNITPLTNTLIDALTEWNFPQIFSEGAIGDDLLALEKIESTQQESITSTISIVSGKIKQALEIAKQNDIASTAEPKRLSIVQTVYTEYENYIRAVYTRFATHKELNLEELSSTVNDMCIFIRDNRRYVLRINPSMDAQNKEFLISHSMRSTVFALTIGLQLKLPLSKLIELGVACIVHEIGMIKLPPQIYMTDRPLTPPEKNAIYTHPILTYDILKSYGFPLSIGLAALEHHEKEDGSGYPRRIDGSKISMYAKVIAVACSFEAITAPRHYKEAQSTHDAMVEMLKNTGKQYDEIVIKALLYSMSLFPIGSYVYLSDGKIGLIVDANPEDPKNPIVQLINEKTETGESPTVTSGKNGVKIVRVLTKNETASLLESLKS